MNDLFLEAGNKEKLLESIISGTEEETKDFLVKNISSLSPSVQRELIIFLLKEKSKKDIVNANDLADRLGQVEALKELSQKLKERAEKEEEN
jgi:hypothetical protein